MRAFLAMDATGGELSYNHGPDATRRADATPMFPVIADLMGQFAARDPHLGKVIAGPAGDRLNRSSPAHSLVGPDRDRPNRWRPLE
jgi:hypothetical protein